jgi:hypothetical protein
MDCQKFQDDLPLLLYGELSAAEMEACLEHVAICPTCQAERQQLERLNAVLSRRPPVEVSGALLAEARLALDESLDLEQHGWRALWSSGFRTLRFQPASGLALALTLVLCGFWVGWGLRPHANRLAPVTRGEVNSAGAANQDLENMSINRISRVDPDPQTGGVKIVMDAQRRVTLEGSMDDPQIQRVLVYTVKNYDNPGIRRDTLDALRNHADNPTIRQALIYAMQNDPNAGVRLEALGAVSEMKSETDVHSALLHTLEHDTNPGVRVAAVDALVDKTQTPDWDAPTAKTFAHLASTDSNPYVRLRCANAVLMSEK